MCIRDSRYSGISVSHWSHSSHNSCCSHSSYIRYMYCPLDLLIHSVIWLYSAHSTHFVFVYHWRVIVVRALRFIESLTKLISVDFWSLLLSHNCLSQISSRRSPFSSALFISLHPSITPSVFDVIKHSDLSSTPRPLLYHLPIYDPYLQKLSTQCTPQLRCFSLF